ncbi:Cx9C motif-containing protein 4, mitochondrial [Hypsizygus marmoreus]|uniref:Cx9C motif-containing protein 4, mitochondrial n=1 Tax=Hypsizygus marmoreus TaxID=39966 RepID=A0A369JK32_HYPMA|nr:Cx9C motif-containing protein 4, mitochondrial [Hypsizygus marmoreus]
MSKQQACQAEACELQACLNKNTYAPEKCDDQLRKLYECCQRMYDSKTGDAANGGNESTACPMPSVVKRWLKDHPASGGKG